MTETMEISVENAIKCETEKCCFAMVKIRDGETLENKGEALKCFACERRGPTARDMPSAIAAWNIEMIDGDDLNAPL
jgi:hypothetical protein